MKLAKMAMNSAAQMSRGPSKVSADQRGASRTVRKGHTEIARISSGDHGQPTLVEDITVNQDSSGSTISPLPSRDDILTQRHKQ